MLTISFSCRKIELRDSANPFLEECNTPVEEDLHFCILPVNIDATTDMETWRRYLQTNLELDSAIINNVPKGNYTAVVQFRINPNGMLDQAKLLYDPGFGLGERALEAVENYPGKWEPVEMGGLKVSSFRNQPITYAVADE